MGHDPDEDPPRVQPWWTHRRFRIQELEHTEAFESALYARSTPEGWEYVYMQWRAGSAYMFGWFRNGKSVLPPDPPVVSRDEFRDNGWRKY